MTSFSWLYIQSNVSLTVFYTQINELPSLSVLSIWYTAHSPSLKVFFYPLPLRSVKVNPFLCKCLIVRFSRRSQRRVFQYIQQYGTFHVALLTIGSEGIQESNSAVFVIAVKRIRRTQSSRSRKRPIFQVHLVSNDSLRPKKKKRVFCKTWRREREQVWVISLWAKLPFNKRGKGHHNIQFNEAPD